MARAPADKQGNDWRSDLLSSGVPLERQTSATLSKLGYQTFGEQTFEYEEEFHSVDIRAFRSGSVEKDSSLIAEISVFAECKYLRPPKQLFFLRFPEPVPGAFRSISMNAVMAAGIETPLGASTEEQQTAVSSTITDLMTQWIPATAGHCQKGVMIPREKDKHDIFSIAQFQLSLPLMDTFLSTFEAANNLTRSGTQPPESFRGFLGPDFPSIRIVLYAPLLVTNAPILILHNDVDLKQIESAKDVVDIADAQPYVTWVTNTLGSVGKHTREDVNRILKEIDAKPALPSFALTAFAMFLLPRRFHVVQVDALDPFIKEIEKNFIDGCKKLLVKGAGSATS